MLRGCVSFQRRRARAAPQQRGERRAHRPAHWRAATRVGQLQEAPVACARDRIARRCAAPAGHGYGPSAGRLGFRF